MNLKRIEIEWRVAMVAAAMALVACGDDGESRGGQGGSTSAKTQAELCAELCKQSETDCVAALEGASVDDCSSRCATETDTSLEFLQCDIDATDCDGYAACKMKF
jgi:hypothetical protein